MRKLLNNLYITTPNAYLTKDGENIVVKIDEQDKFRIPIHNLENILCFSYAGASPALMKHCAQNGVGLAFFTPNGNFLARVNGAITGNVFLRKTQYRWSENEEKSLSLARIFILGKVINARTVLQRTLRDYGENKKIKQVVSYLKGRYHSLQNAQTIDTLRGIEGDCARQYFSVFDCMIRVQKEDFYFNERSRRPALDRVNCLLSFTYSLLRHDIQSALESVGLDPFVGYLHKDRPGRPSLALDLMEELRAVLADRLSLSLINRKQLCTQDFHVKENKSVLLTDNARKIILQAWQHRKQTEITHPFLEEKMPIGLIPYSQALLLARYLRGDLEGYPPFIWR